MICSLLDTPSQPGKPKIKSVTNDSVQIWWSEPEKDGGSPITHYVIEYRNADDRPEEWEEIHEDVTSTTYTVDGLHTRDEYHFRVYAVNKCGPSKASLESDSVVVKGKPDQITFFKP